jgi:thiamine pyrophosphate-dependent acetolactate synthase large subunit-like protein
LSLGVVDNPVAGSRGRIANKVVGEADVVLVVGSRMDGRTTRGYTLLSPTAKLIQIDIDPQETGEVPPDPVAFSPQDFSKIAQAFNCFGARAEKPGDIRGAIVAAHRAQPL